MSCVSALLGAKVGEIAGTAARVKCDALMYSIALTEKLQRSEDVGTGAWLAELRSLLVEQESRRNASSEEIKGGLSDLRASIEDDRMGYCVTRFAPNGMIASVSHGGYGYVQIGTVVRNAIGGVLVFR